MQELENGLETLDRLEESRNEEMRLQQALGWATVMSTRAEVEKYTMQLEEKGPGLQEQALRDQEEAKQERDRLEEENKSKVVAVCFSHIAM